MKRARTFAGHVVVLAALIGACDKGAVYTLPAASEYTVSSMPLSIPPLTDTVQVAAITQEFLPATDVHALLGRLFIADEFKQPETRTAVISYGLWQRRFKGNASIIGRQIQLGGQSVVVVGVVPENFVVPPGAAIWLPRQPTR